MGLIAFIKGRACIKAFELSSPGSFYLQTSFDVVRQVLTPDDEKMQKFGSNFSVRNIEPRLPNDGPLLEVLGRRDDGEDDERRLLLEPVEAFQQLGVVFVMRVELVDAARA